MNGSGNGLFFLTLFVAGTEVKLEIASGQPFPLPECCGVGELTRFCCAKSVNWLLTVCAF